MIDYNICGHVDFYKNCHWSMYPKDMWYGYSYMSARKGSVLWFGLRYYLMKYLTGNVVTLEKIKEAKDLVDGSLGKKVFNLEGWMGILFKYDGRLPVLIKSIPELEFVNENIPLLTIENTDSKYPWVSSYLETLLINLWYPTSVATLARTYKGLLEIYSKTCSDPAAWLKTALSNSGMRSSACPEAGALASAAHLLSFHCTTSPAGISLLKKYYGSYWLNYPSATNGAEHSVITSYGQENELSAYISCLNSFPELPITIPVDSYNIYHAVEKFFGDDLKETILKRPGTVYVRPDSGDVIPVLLKVTKILANKFGYQANNKGYNVLNKIRIIQGDGIDKNSLPKICEAIVGEGFSLENYKFGCGGSLVHSDVNRDTFGFAQKLSSVRMENKDEEGVCKNPITDSKKASLKGRFRVKKINNKFMIDNNCNSKDNYLKTVFEDGSLYN